jgi:hypothetical protein
MQYAILAYFLEGDTAAVSGRAADDSWLVIQPASSETPCWIARDRVTLRGELALAPVLAAPATPAASVTPTAEALGVRYYLIQPGTGGPFGCGDGLVYFYTGEKGSTPEQNIAKALNALFSLQSEYVNGYYNPLHGSRLRVASVTITSKDAAPIIQLKGNLLRPKNDCEADRIRDVVWTTVRQYTEGYPRPGIWLGDALFGDLLQATTDKE